MGNIAWRYGSDDRVDGKEAAGNSMGRAPFGRSDERADGKETVGNSFGGAP